MYMELKQALLNLDPKDDTQWTEEGLPVMEALKKLTGNSQLSRKQVTDAEPQFNREVAAKSAVQETVKKEDPETAEQDPKAAGETEQEPKAAVDPATVVHQDPNPEQSIPAPNPSEMDEKVASQINQVEGEIAELQICRDGADGQIQILMREAEALRDRRTQLIGPRENMQRQLDFIKMQGVIRAEKHARTQRILKSIKASDIDPRSKLDRSFQRRTARGGKRPVVPVSMQVLN